MTTDLTCVTGITLSWENVYLLHFAFVGVGESVVLPQVPF